MAWQQSDVDALEAEIAQARTSIKHGDKSISYESLGDRVKLLAQMRREVGKRKPVVHFASFSRGEK